MIILVLNIVLYILSIILGIFSVIAIHEIGWDRILVYAVGALTLSIALFIWSTGEIELLTEQHKYEVYYIKDNVDSYYVKDIEIKSGSYTVYFVEDETTLLSSTFDYDVKCEYEVGEEFTSSRYKIKNIKEITKIENN